MITPADQLEFSIVVPAYNAGDTIAATLDSVFAPADQPMISVVWAALCLLGLLAIRAYGTADTEKRLPPDWTHIGISAVAFLIWVYQLGGPFAAYGLHVPYIGSLQVLAWTFFVPMVYKGPEE